MCSKYDNYSRLKSQYNPRTYISIQRARKSKFKLIMNKTYVRAPKNYEKSGCSFHLDLLHIVL
jgi:hypothetical protein